MQRPWYTDGMSHALRLALLCSVFLASAAPACKDDDGPKLACQGDVEAHTLGPLEPCIEGSDQCVEGSYCSDGYCTLPCMMDSDCPDYAKIGGGEVVFGVTPLCRRNQTGAGDPTIHGCRYFCSAELSCPDWLGEHITCAPGGFCWTDDICGFGE